MNETKTEQILRNKQNKRKIAATEKKFHISTDSPPPPPPLSSDTHFNKVMDCIRAFEIEQISYDFHCCSVCLKRRLEMKMASDDICSRCKYDKGSIKMFFPENNMDPGPVPEIMQNLSLVEQQLISRISAAIQVHMLKHGGIAANGHCVAFPQNVNEPAQILPKLPEEVQVIRVRKQGRNDSSKEFNVRRFIVQQVLQWLKLNNPAYSDIIISQERLNLLPENDSLEIHIIETNLSDNTSTKDHGPAPKQVDPGEVDGDTTSCFTLPDPGIDIREQVEKVEEEVVGENHGLVTSTRKYVTMPWPTQDHVPLSEFTTKHFFTLAFPCLFPNGTGDFHINRPRTCVSMSNWAEHLLWYKDGHFAHHQYFKFIVHNIIMRKRTLEQSTYIVKQQLGDDQLTLSDLKEKIQNGDKSIAQKVIYFGACLRGTAQYWSHRSKELRSLIQYQINDGKGIPFLRNGQLC